MQRRTAPSSDTYSAASKLPASSQAPSSQTPVTFKGKRRGGSGSGSLTFFTMVAVTILLTFSSWFLFPSYVEEETHKLAQSAMNAERRVEDWVAHSHGVGGGGAEPDEPSDEEDINGVNAATAAMEAQDSFWVDGEKKLKAKLKVLAERQSRGLDLGVPVLTRYLGEDIPAWAGEGVDRAEWQAKVDAKYAEMRLEEEKWRAKMKVFMDANNQNAALGVTTAR